MPTAYHMVHYRKFESSSPQNSKTLEQLCREALSRKNEIGLPLWERAQDRLRLLDEVGGRQILLNKVADLSSAVAGEMCLIQTDGLQALLEMQASKIKISNITTAEIFSLSEKTAPSGTQFIRGMAYWMTIGNHLFFVKTQIMTSQTVNDYLEWLLKFPSPVMQAGDAFTLQAEFDKAEINTDVGEIRNLKVSGRTAPFINVDVKDEKKREVAVSKIIGSGQYIFDKAVSVTEIIFGKEKAESLVQSLGPNEYLSVDAEVKVKGKRTTQSRQKMKEIANELADLTDAKVQVEGRDGKVSGGDAILRTRMPFNLSHESSNFLDFDNVADQLQEVYSRFVRDSKIVA